MKKRQLRPIWQLIFDMTKALGAFALFIALTAGIFLIA
jgi:hypothetical protein